MPALNNLNLKEFLQRLFSFPFFFLLYLILINVTAEEFQAKCNTLVPCFRNDSDKSGNDRWVEKVLHMPFGIAIPFKNLVHHGGFLPVGFPGDTLVTVQDAVALHVHLRGQRLATLSYDGRYLLDFEQINL